MQRPKVSFFPSIFQIQRIQQEAKLKGPDKPPPPYTPPSTPKPKAAPAKKAEKYVPSGREEVEALVGGLAERVFELREREGAEGWTRKEARDAIAKDFKEAGKGASHGTFVAFLLDLGRTEGQPGLNWRMQRVVF